MKSEIQCKKIGNKYHLALDVITALPDYRLTSSDLSFQSELDRRHQSAFKKNASLFIMCPQPGLQTKNSNKDRKQRIEKRDHAT